MEQFDDSGLFIFIGVFASPIDLTKIRRQLCVLRSYQDADNYFHEDYMGQLMAAATACGAQDTLSTTSRDSCTTGRVGCHRGFFCNLGGYDQDFYPSGASD